MRIFAVLALAFIVGVTGYYGGAYLACRVFWPQNNLCGLFGVFVTGPLGLALGGSVGWLLFRPGETSDRH